MNSLKAFNHYLLDIGATKEQTVQLRKDKVRIAVGSEQQVNVLTEQEIERLLFHLEDTSKTSTRDKLIVLLLLYTGIRAGELVRIKLRDIDSLSMTLTIPWGKGGKLRSIPLKAELITVIQDYLSGERKENKNSSEYLLLTQRSGKMDRNAVSKVLNRIGEETELALHPHKFRHTFCTRLLAKKCTTNNRSHAGRSCQNTDNGQLLYQYQSAGQEERSRPPVSYTKHTENIHYTFVDELQIN